MDSNKKTFNFSILFIVVYGILVLLALIWIWFPKNKKQSNVALKYDVIDSNQKAIDIYTVKLKKLLSKGNLEELYSRLDLNYVMENNITKDNYQDFLEQRGYISDKINIISSTVNVQENDTYVYRFLYSNGVKKNNYVNVIETEQKGVFNNRVASYKNLMGEAVVHAVKLEGLKREDGTKIKGPRLVLNSPVYEQLNKETKLYVRQLPEDKNYYEILWPAMGYILENKDTFDQEFNHFDELFNPAFNLWKYYKAKDVANNTEVKIHYERFLELIVASAIRIYNYMGMKNSVLQNLSTIIKNKFSNDDRICIFEGVVENSLT